MLEILRILRRASQNIGLNIVHTVITLLAQDSTGNVPWTSTEGLADLHETFKELSGNQY